MTMLAKHLRTLSTGHAASSGDAAGLVFPLPACRWFLGFLAGSPASFVGVLSFGVIVSVWAPSQRPVWPFQVSHLSDILHWLGYLLIDVDSFCFLEVLRDLARNCSRSPCFLYSYVVGRR